MYLLPAAAGSVSWMRLEIGHEADMGVAGNWQYFFCLSMMMKSLQMTTALTWPHKLCLAFIK